VVALALSTFIALVVGWLAGMVTRQRASRWCPYDGARLACLECARAGLHVLDNGGKQPREAEDTSAPFRHAMWQATEQALRYGLDQAMLEAVFDVLEAAARERDRAERDGDGPRAVIVPE
jgi:hypothetical protein